MLKQIEVSGTDLLRQVVKAKRTKLNFAQTARDAGVPMTTLEAFSNGTADLTPEVLIALTPLVMPTAIFDPAINKLRPAITAPVQQMSAYPEKFVPGKVPLTGGVNLGAPKKQQQTVLQRLGWA